MEKKRTWVAASALVLALLCVREARATNMPPVTWYPAATTNYDSSRAPIDMVVIHKAEGSALSAAYTFQNPGRQASAHYSVGDDVVYQMVDEGATAWHDGNYAYNQRSIGIENGGYTYRDDFTDAHYHLLAQLVANICERHGIPEDRGHIIGHNEVPDPYHPGEFGGVDHHTDPGPYFNWSYFISLVRAYSGGGSTGGGGGGSVTNQGVSIQTGTLNVRASAWGTIIGQVHQDQAYVATGNSSQGFIEIWFRGQTAWVYASYTTPLQHWAARVDVPDLNARDAPSLSGAIVGQVHQGQIYIQLQATTQWRQVSYDENPRWIYFDYSTGLNVSG